MPDGNTQLVILGGFILLNMYVTYSYIDALSKQTVRHVFVDSEGVVRPYLDFEVANVARNVEEIKNLEAIRELCTNNPEIIKQLQVIAKNPELIKQLLSINENPAVMRHFQLITNHRDIMEQLQVFMRNPKFMTQLQIIMKNPETMQEISEITAKNVKANSIILESASGPYQINFQDPATPIADRIIEIHHHVFFFLVLVLIFVS